MKKMVCLCLISLKVFAAPGSLQDSFATISSTLKMDPHFLIESCINPATGVFFQVEEDAVFPGYEPIRIQRKYISSHQASRSSKWEFFDDLFLEVLPIRGSTANQLLFKDPSGAAVFFEECIEQKKKVKDLYRPVDLGNMKGYCNTSTGEISGRSNDLNQRIRYYPSDNIYHAVGPDGTQRWYASSRSKRGLRRLQKLRKPSGNCVLYTYDEHDRVLEIKTTNPKQDKCYTKVSFLYQNTPNNAASFVATAELGQKTHHIFQLDDEFREARAFYLDYIMRPAFPSLQYHYQQLNAFGPRLMSTKLLENTPIMEIRYHPARDKTMLDRMKKKTVDPLDDRVESLYRPVGENEKMVCTHVLSYDLPKTLHPDHGKFGYLGAQGKCDVVDAKKRKTEYHFTATFQPIAIRKIGVDPLKNDSTVLEVISAEDYVWQEPTSGPRRLHCKSLSDGKMTYFGTLYEYDNEGNILQEHQLGNFSGLYKKSLPIAEFLAKKKPFAAFEESKTTTFTYTKDDYRSIQTKEEAGGLFFEYVYLPDTNLLMTTYTKAKGKIIQRNFSLYNDDHVVIEKIQDDGSGRSSQDLTDVTFRKVTKIQPKEKQPALNFPEVIEEFVFDRTQVRLLLSTKKVLFYDNNCNIIREDLYDDQNTFVCSLFYEYDEKGHLVKETDALGRVQSKKYNSFGFLIEEKPFTSCLTTCYEVDTLGRRKSSYQKGDNTTFKTYYEYNAVGELIKKTDGFGYVTIYQYDDRGYVKSVANNHCTNLERKSQISSVTFLRDAQGFILKEIDNKGSGSAILRSYNVRGQVTDILYPDQTSEHILYDLFGNITQRVDRMGLVTKSTYDLLGRIIKKTTSGSSIKAPLVESWVYDSNRFLSYSNHNGLKTSYEYDERGRLIKEIQRSEDEILSHQQYGYDAQSRRNLIIVSNTDGTVARVKHLVFDLGDRVIEEREEDLRGHLYSKVNYKYDISSQKTEVIQIVGDTQAIFRYEYDPFGRMLSSTDAYENKTCFSYETISCHDTVLQRVITEDPKGIRTLEDYNGEQKLLRKRVENSFDELLYEELYSYDLGGNLLGGGLENIKRTAFQGESAKTIETRYIYDAMHRVLQKIEFASSSSPITTSYQYKFGLLEKTIQNDGSEMVFEYDEFSRLTKEFSSDGSIHYSLIYDDNGNLREIIDHVQKNSLKRRYDSQGRQIEEIFPSGLIIKNDYDSFGRKIKLTLPDQSCLKYAYDTYHLMKVQRFTNSGNLRYEHHYDEYNLLHEPVKERAPFDVMDITKDYRKDGQLQSLNTPYFKETVVSFDPLGNKEKVYQESVLFKGDISYVLDAFSHVEEEKGIQQHSYSYDALHTRVQKDQKPYDLSRMEVLLKDGSFNYESDGLGRRTQKSVGSKTLNYTYDALGRLTSLETSSLKIVYTYDYFHRKLSKAVYQKAYFGGWDLACREHYLLDGEEDIAAFDESQQLINLKVMGIDSAIALEIGTTTYVPICDLQGNIIALIDEAWKSVSESYRYSFYGEEIIYGYFHQLLNNSKLKNPWRFQGQRIDEESGLIWINKKWLDPANGSYLSKLFSADSKQASAQSSFFLPSSLKNAISPMKDSVFSEYREGFDHSAAHGRRFKEWMQKIEGRGTQSKFHDPLLSQTKESIPKWMKEVMGSENIRISEIPGYQSPHLFFSYNNGVWTSYEEACEAAKAISEKLAGHEVTLIYDPHHGLFDFTDVLVKNAGKKIGAITATTHLLLHELQQGKTVIPMGFSKGGLTLKMALSDKRFDPYRDRIYPRTFGSPVAITPEEGTDPINYISSSDLIPYSLFHFKEFCGDHHTKVPSHKWWFEHSFLKKTYQEALKRECEKILQQFGF